jgi:hypothetical protein
MCGPIRTVRIMNDHVSTVGAGQDVFARGQCGPDEAVLEQRVAGSFFDFSLTHPARSEKAVVTTGTTTSFRNCQSAGLVVAVKAEVCEADVERSRAAFTGTSEGPARAGNSSTIRIVKSESWLKPGAERRGKE